MNSVIVWFRKDLRLSDNPALVWAVEYANTQSMALIPLFIDSDGDESPWSLGGASRVWLHESLKSLQTSLEALGSTLILRKGPAVDVLKQVAKETDARAICWNRRYEPAIIERDQKIKSYFGSQNIEARSFNGSLLREPWEIQNKQGKPFQVYTPFYKTLSASLDEISDPLKIPSKIPVSSKFPQSDSLASLQLLPKISWHESIQKNWTVAESSAQIQLNNFLNQPILTYSEARNRPAVHGTSRLSPYLHWGQISPRQIWNQIRSKYRQPKEGVEVYSKEIIWREFAYHLLFHFPHTPAKPLRAEFELFPWKVNSPHWNHWIQGLTGYPIVDAGMRELWTTGWMHNRVRMIVASFLVKDLLIPWQEGAKWFWDTLVDADLASNTMGWQWTAGCGADAAPYFRVFNPVLQGEKFDPNGEYIKRWVPELEQVPEKFIHRPWESGLKNLSYPSPIVDHGEARKNALSAYQKIRKKI